MLNIVKTIDKTRQAARETYAWPGGYRQWLLMADGESICPECARKEWRQVARATKNRDDKQWQVAEVYVNWEGPAQQCAHCGASHESEYGEVD